MIKFDKVLMNPPYDGNLHLKILEKVLLHCPDAEVINLSPVRWLEDPLADLKQASDKKKFKDSILASLSDLKILDTTKYAPMFNIVLNGDLGIYIFNNKTVFDTNSLLSDLAKKCFDKIIMKVSEMATFADKYVLNNEAGWHCEIKEVLPITTAGVGSKIRNDITSRLNCVEVVPVRIEAVYFDGKTLHSATWPDGTHWSDTRAKGGVVKDRSENKLHWSMAFQTEAEAYNFRDSCRATFFKNWVYLIKYDMHAPLRFIPYMGDYTKVWTNKDYCEYFSLTEEESKFMCRVIEDYRVKDFLGYEEI